MKPQWLNARCLKRVLEHNARQQQEAGSFDSQEEEHHGGPLAKPIGKPSVLQLLAECSAVSQNTPRKRERDESVQREVVFRAPALSFRAGFPPQSTMAYDEESLPLPFEQQVDEVINIPPKSPAVVTLLANTTTNSFYVPPSYDTWVESNHKRLQCT